MCVVCHELRPWTEGCDFAAAEDLAAPHGSAWAASPSGAARSGASAGLPSLSTGAIATKLLTDYWNIGSPRSLDARAGDTVTFDVGALTSAGQSLARAALEEWSIVTGLEFREVGGFRPSAVRREGGDASASTGTGARMALGEAFEGRIGGGDRDWVRVDLRANQTATVAVEGAGSGRLDSPGLALFDALGRAIAVPVQTSGSSAEVTVATTNGGGTYYVQVSGRGGDTGGYRLTVREPGGAGAGRISFDDDGPGAYAGFSLSGRDILAADVNVSTGWLASHGTGRASYSFQTYLHEIGHALGLGHPGDYDQNARFGADAEFRNDSWQATVMSYFDQRDNHHVDADKAFAVTPMAADIEAVRRLYGEPNVRHGDTTYGEDSNAGGMLGRVARFDQALAFTVFDTGGDDRVKLSSQRADQTLDLRPGRHSDLFGHDGNMTIAPGTVIEDAIMGRGDDRVIGNDAGNHIRGRRGEDRIDGGRGHDRLEGGDGDDRLDGGRGRDALRGGDDDDLLLGRDGDDRLHGDGGADRIWGGGGRDTAFGGSGHDRIGGGSSADRLYGSGGHDVLSGDGGRDRLSGGDGNDRLRGGDGDDRLVGGRGRDTLVGNDDDDRLEGGGGKDQLKGGRDADLVRGGDGDDRLHGNKGRDRLEGEDGGDELSGGPGRDALRGGAGWDRLEGGDGDDDLGGGGGRDRLIGGADDDRLKGGSGSDTFVFAGRFGRDRIDDFDARDDRERIDLSDVRAIRNWRDLERNHLEERGDDVVIDAGSAGRLRLEDVRMGDLDRDDFVF